MKTSHSYHYITKVERNGPVAIVKPVLVVTPPDNQGPDAPQQFIDIPESYWRVVTQPGVIPRWLGLTHDKRIELARQRVQRWCDEQNNSLELQRLNYCPDYTPKVVTLPTRG